MNESAAAVTSIAHQIQLAVAPVFPLAGIAGTGALKISRQRRREKLAE